MIIEIYSSISYLSLNLSEDIKKINPKNIVQNEDIVYYSR